MKKILFYLFCAVVAGEITFIYINDGKKYEKVLAERSAVVVTPTPSLEPSPTSTASATPSVMSATSTKSPAPTQKPTSTSAPTNSPTPTATPSPQPTYSSQQINEFINRFAGQYGVDPNVLRYIALCESGFNPLAQNLGYAGLYQFGATTWQTYRKKIGEDGNPDLRLNAEEAVQTAAYVISIGNSYIWPNCVP